GRGMKRRPQARTWGRRRPPQRRPHAPCPAHRWRSAARGDSGAAGAPRVIPPRPPRRRCVPVHAVSCATLPAVDVASSPKLLPIRKLPIETSESDEPTEPIDSWKRPGLACCREGVKGRDDETRAGARLTKAARREQLL